MPDLSQASAVPAGTPPPAAPAAAPQAPTPAQLPQPFSAVAAREMKAFARPPEPKTHSLTPVSAFAAQNLDTILRAGIDAYEAKDKATVFFNPTLVTHKELQKLDAEGKLHEVAPLIKSPSAVPTKARTVHTSAPKTAYSAQNSAPDASGAPAQGVAAPADGSGATPLSGPPIPATPGGSLAAAQAIPKVPQNKRLASARIQSLKQDNKPAAQDPKTVVDRIKKRAI